LLGRLLAKNANDRPRSAAEVVEALAPLSVGSDLVGLLRDRPVPETDQESSVDAGLFDEAFGTAPAQPPASSKSSFHRVWPVFAVAAIVAGSLAWWRWPRHRSTGAVPPAVSQEQQASPTSSAGAATAKTAPTLNHKPTPPSPPPVPSAEVNRMTQSWKDTHNEFQKLMEQVDAGNRQLEKENQRRDAEADESKSKFPSPLK